MYYIGIDIGGTNIRSSILKKDGAIINLIKNNSTKNIVSDIIENIINQITYSKNKNLTITGVGISIGGIIDSNGNIINVSKIGKWKNINLKNKLINILTKDKILETTVLNNFIIDNDGNCSAHYVKYLGCCKNCNDFITVTLGTGVGIGIYTNNKIIQMSEFGYLVEDKCCGKYFDSIEKEKNRNILIDNGAKFLGVKLAEMCNILSPEKIILNGVILNITDSFIKLITETFYENLLINKTNIIFSQKKNQPLIGSILSLK